MGIRKKIKLVDLKEHLYSLPEQPDLIPYLTSFYNENWGFCLSHNDFLKLEEDAYEVYIDSSVKEGHLTFGEYVVEGKSTDEVLISAHICHPSVLDKELHLSAHGGSHSRSPK